MGIYLTKGPIHLFDGKGQSDKLAQQRFGPDGLPIIDKSFIERIMDKTVNKVNGSAYKTRYSKIRTLSDDVNNTYTALQQILNNDRDLVERNKNMIFEGIYGHVSISDKKKKDTYYKFQYAVPRIPLDDIMNMCIRAGELAYGLEKNKYDAFQNTEKQVNDFIHHYYWWFVDTEPVIIRQKAKRQLEESIGLTKQYADFYFAMLYNETTANNGRIYDTSVIQKAQDEIAKRFDNDAESVKYITRIFESLQTCEKQAIDFNQKSFDYFESLLKESVDQMRNIYTKVKSR